MGLNRGPLGGGEGDECTCAQCRGDVPDWLPRLDEREEQPQDAWPA
jgi:hypothetical protein